MHMAEEHRTSSTLRTRGGHHIGELEERLDRLAEGLRSGPRPQTPAPWAVLPLIVIMLVVVGLPGLVR